MSNSFRNGVFSSLLLVLDSFAKKLVGLASTLVLARVLLPEDFGIIAIASLMIGFMDILANTGGAQYLLRVDNLDEDKVNTSWTINFILKSILATAMIPASFVIADYYGDPRLTYILLWLTAAFFCHSLQNPGLAFLRRTQNYKNIVKLTVITKVGSAAAAVTSAIILESYWALVIGQGTSAVLMAIGSYLIHSHRPKFVLLNAKAQWEFSGWMIPQGVFGYFRTQLDTFIVSSSFGSGLLGSYHTMKYIAFIPSSEIILPISKPFLVELANSKASPSYFAKQLKASFMLLMMIALPMSLIMLFHHADVTLLILGENWVEYSYLFAAFGLLIPAYVMRQQANRVLLVFGKTKQLFLIECLTFAVVYGTLLLNGINDIKSFSFLLVQLEILVSAVYFSIVLARYTGLASTFSFMFSVLPLIVAALVGLTSSNLVVLSDVHVFFQLTLLTIVFVTTFALTIYIFYQFGFKRFHEWEYLYSLLDRIAAPLLRGLKVK